MMHCTPKTHAAPSKKMKADPINLIEFMESKPIAAKWGESAWSFMISNWNAEVSINEEGRISNWAKLKMKRDSNLAGPGALIDINERTANEEISESSPQK